MDVKRNTVIHLDIAMIGSELKAMHVLGLSLWVDPMGSIVVGTAAPSGFGQLCGPEAFYRIDGEQFTSSAFDTDVYHYSNRIDEKGVPELD